MLGNAIVGCQSSNATLIKLNVCFITFICLHANTQPPVSSELQREANYCKIGASILSFGQLPRDPRKNKIAYNNNL